MSVGSESVSFLTDYPFLTSLSGEGRVREFSHDTIVTKLPKTEQECPKKRNTQSAEGLAETIWQPKCFTVTSPQDDSYY